MGNGLKVRKRLSQCQIIIGTALEILQKNYAMGRINLLCFHNSLAHSL